MLNLSVTEVVKDVEKTPQVEVEKEKKKRIYYLDILRVMAICGVILVHEVAVPTSQIAFIGTEHWWIANAINGVLRWAVPVFFMITGALVLSSKKQQDLGGFYKKSFKRLGIPFVAWSIIYFLFEEYYLGGKEVAEAWEMIFLFLKKFIMNDVYPHLWFMYVILTLYFVMPFIKKIAQNSSRKELLVIIYGWFVISFIVPQFNEIYAATGGEKLSLRIFDIPLLTGYMGYLILGYYLKNYEVGKWSKRLIYIAGFISASVISTLVYLQSIDCKELDETLYDHFSIPCLFMAVAVFLLIKSVDWDNVLNVKMKKIISSMSAASFGIYFVHLVVAEALLTNLSKMFLKDSLVVIPIYIVALICNVFISYIFVKVVSLNSKLKTLLVG